MLITLDKPVALCYNGMLKYNHHKLVIIIIDMKIFTKTIQLNTQAAVEAVNITSAVEQAVQESRVKEGHALIFTRHTTSAVVINEAESGLLADIRATLEEMISRQRTFKHDDKHAAAGERRNGWSHIQSILLGASQTIPIIGGRLRLGRWQSTLFIELDGPRQGREIVAQIMGE